MIVRYFLIFISVMYFSFVKNKYSDQGPICATYVEPPYDKEKPTFAIMGFLLAKHVREWREKSLDERRNAIAAQYAAAFECEEMKSPIAYDEFDWNKEEFSRGCYTGVCPPGNSCYEKIRNTNLMFFFVLKNIK